MTKPTITVTTTNSVYYLTTDEYSRAVKNGLEYFLGAEQIVTVKEDLDVDVEWVKDGF